MNGKVEFEAGGVSRYMKMSTNAQVRYQRAAGETLLTGITALDKDPSDTDRLRRLIWASMSHEDGFTEDNAGDIMDELGIELAMSKLGEAVRAAYPKATADASGNGQRATKRPK